MFRLKSDRVGVRTDVPLGRLPSTAEGPGPRPQTSGAVSVGRQAVHGSRRVTLNGGERGRPSTTGT